MSTDGGKTVTFETVLKEELEVVFERRRLLHDRNLSTAALGRDLPRPRDEGVGVNPRAVDQRAVSAIDMDAVGLALSGGGVRSASVCLGVLQALDGASPKGDPSDVASPPKVYPTILDRVDYLSTVSGGGYIGASLVNAMRQSEGAFPFSSKLDHEETPETKHLRDYSSYLTPRGFWDAVTGIVVVLRGMVVNLLIFLSAILLAAGVTVLFNPTRADLEKSMFPGVANAFVGWLIDPYSMPFAWSVIGAIILLAAGLLVVIRIGSSDLRRREKIDRRLRKGFVVLVVVFLFEAQGYVLDILFQSSIYRSADANAPALLRL